MRGLEQQAASEGFSVVLRAGSSSLNGPQLKVRPGALNGLTAPQVNGCEYGGV